MKPKHPPGPVSSLVDQSHRVNSETVNYDERGKPMIRAKLKAMKWAQQNRTCAHCGEEMPMKYSELDGKNAADGYTPANTELVHAKCHQEREAAKGYT